MTEEETAKNQRNHIVELIEALGPCWVAQGLVMHEEARQNLHGSTLNDIHRPGGLLRELKQVNEEYRERLTGIIAAQKSLPITQARAIEETLFEEWKNLVFDIIHASTVFGEVL